MVVKYQPQGECLEIHHNTQTTLFISKDLLKSLVAQRSKIKRWKNEKQRMAFINGGRANSILDYISAEIGTNQCNRMQSRLPQDALYLIARLLNSGQIAVQNNELHTFEEQISVHYKAHKGIMGHAFYL